MSEQWIAVWPVVQRKNGQINQAMNQSTDSSVGNGPWMQKRPKQLVPLEVDGLNLTSCFLTSIFRSDLHCHCFKVIKHWQSCPFEEHLGMPKMLLLLFLMAISCLLPSSYFCGAALVHHSTILYSTTALQFTLNNLFCLSCVWTHAF